MKKLRTMLVLVLVVLALGLVACFPTENNTPVVEKVRDGKTIDTAIIVDINRENAFNFDLKKDESLFLKFGGDGTRNDFFFEVAKESGLSFTYKVYKEDKSFDFAETEPQTEWYADVSGTRTTYYVEFIAQADGKYSYRVDYSVSEEVRDGKTIDTAIIVDINRENAFNFDLKKDESLFLKFGGDGTRNDFFFEVAKESGLSFTYKVYKEDKSFDFAETEPQTEWYADVSGTRTTYYVEFIAQADGKYSYRVDYSVSEEVKEGSTFETAIVVTRAADSAQSEFKTYEVTANQVMYFKITTKNEEVGLSIGISTTKDRGATPYYYATNLNAKIYDATKKDLNVGRYLYGDDNDKYYWGPNNFDTEANTTYYIEITFIVAGTVSLEFEVA